MPDDKEFLMIQHAPGIFRGPRPKWSEDILDLHHNGIKTVLDLQGSSDNRITGAIFEVGMLSFELNLCPFLPPSRRNLAIGVEIINRKEFQPIFVHCRLGHDRTGMLCAYDDIKKGMPKYEAIAKMYSLGMSWQLRWWNWFL